MFAIAILALRLTSGRGKEFAIHGTTMVKAETAPHGMRNMAKYRAPNVVDPVTMALPIAATTIRQKICRDRSPVLEAVQLTHTDVRKAANQTA